MVHLLLTPMTVVGEKRLAASDHASMCLYAKKLVEVGKCLVSDSENRLFSSANTLVMHFTAGLELGLRS